MNEHVDCVKACLARKVDINLRFTLNTIFGFPSRTLLYFATELGRNDCVEVLIKAGAEIADDTLLLAGKFGSERCTKLFLEAGGDVSKILYSAASNDRQNIVSLLIASGADVNIRNRYGGTALFDAVRNNSVQCTDLLLKSGADVNIQDKYGNTALLFAVSEGRELCTDLLLKAGADVNITANDGKTALFYAATADVNMKDKQGKRALLYAASGGSVKCVDLLLKAGADVNIQSQGDGTALFHAVSVGSVQYTDLLLKTGADVNVTNQIGKTVLFLTDWWCTTITIEILNSVKLILRKGIKVNVRGIKNGWNALSYFLYDTFKFDGPHSSTFAILLLSAGETVDTYATASPA